MASKTLPSNRNRLIAHLGIPLTVGIPRFFRAEDIRVLAEVKKRTGRSWEDVKAQIIREGRLSVEAGRTMG